VTAPAKLTFLARRSLSYASGAAEIAGGVGLIRSANRRLGGWRLVATLVALDD
jgi:uncharacterized membrane protein